MNRTVAVVLGGVGVGGAAYVAYDWLFGDYRAPKDTPPDEAATPDHTGYKRVDALLPKLKEVASSSGIPLGLLVGWIAKESAGKLATHPQPGPGDTKMDERGYFQLMPDESKELGIDHQRLSTDSDYSLDAGVKLVRHYQAVVDALGAAKGGTTLYWLLVKLAHTVGSGQLKKWARAAQAAARGATWDDFKAFVLGEHWTGPQPKKWLPFVDEVYAVGRPFGFGSPDAPLVSGIWRRRRTRRSTRSGLMTLGGSR